MPQEVLYRDSDVTTDQAQKAGGDVATGVERYRCRPAIGVSELFVGSLLTRFAEAQVLEDTDDIPRLEDRNVAHLGDPDSDRLNPDEFRLQGRFTILEEEFDDFFEVLLELVERLGLRMRPGEARNVAYE